MAHAVNPHRHATHGSTSSTRRALECSKAEPR